MKTKDKVICCHCWVLVSKENINFHTRWYHYAKHLVSYLDSEYNKHEQAMQEGQEK